MDQRRRENLDDVILSIFEEDNDLFFPVSSDRDAREFTRLLQGKGVASNRLSQELEEPEFEINCWLKGLKKSAVGRKVMRRINQPLTDYLRLESELEYENSFVYVEELDAEGFDGTDLTCYGVNDFVDSSAVCAERVIARSSCGLLRGIKRRKHHRVPPIISEANGEQSWQSSSDDIHIVQSVNLKCESSDQGAPVDESDFGLADSERELDVVCEARVVECCSQDQLETNDCVAIAEADDVICSAETDQSDCKVSSQPDWDDICDRFLLADESSLYEEIQETAESVAIDQCPDQESCSAWSVTHAGHPTEDNHVTTDNTPTKVEYCPSASPERTEKLEMTIQHTSELLTFDCNFADSALSINVDGRSTGESKGGEGGHQEDDGQSPNTSPDGQIEMDRSLTVSTEMEDINKTGTVNDSVSDSVDSVEIEVLQTPTSPSAFELENQSTLNALGAEVNNGGESLKSASVTEQCLPEYTPSEYLEKCSRSTKDVFEEISSPCHSEKSPDLRHSTSGKVLPSVKNSTLSSGFSEYDPPATEVESCVSRHDHDNFDLCSEKESVELLPTASEELNHVHLESVHNVYSSPVGGSALLENDFSINNSTGLEAEANEESSPLFVSEPLSQSASLQDSEQFQEFQETKPFTQTSLLEELDLQFSLFDKSKHVDVAAQDNRCDVNNQPQLSSSCSVDPEDCKFSASTSLSSSDAASQEQPGYIYVFTDGCSSSKVQRFKVGSVSCPYEELQRARMFNVDIKLVSATAHSSPDRVFQQIKSRLERWKMEGKEDWFLCPSTIILQTITEVINTHL